jgi:foldase protein PrsA
MVAKAKTKSTKISKVSKAKTVKAKRNIFETLTLKIDKLKSKRYFSLIFAVLILLLITYLGRSLLFAASVGGRPITRIKLIRELEKQAGQQALDSLITKELINQEAKRQGIIVTDQDVNSEIDRITAIVEAQGTTLDNALALQGQTKADLYENIRLQKTVENILSDKINVSDEDVLANYEANKSQYDEGVQFDEIKDSIKDQLVQEKLSSEFQILLEKLKSDGNIIYFIDF